MGSVITFSPFFPSTFTPETMLVLTSVHSGSSLITGFRPWMPGTLLSTLYVFFHLILTLFLEVRTIIISTVQMKDWGLNGCRSLPLDIQLSMAELGSDTSTLSSVVQHHETALWAPTTLFLHLPCPTFPAQLSSARKRNLLSLLKLQRRKMLIGVFFFFFFLLDHIKEKNNLEKVRKFPFSPKGNKLSNCEEWRRSASSSQSSHDKCICLLCYSIHGASLVAKSCLTLVNPWTVAFQAPLSMGFTRKEYWSGLPFPSPGDLPDPGI